MRVVDWFFKLGQGMFFLANKVWQVEFRQNTYLHVGIRLKSGTHITETRKM